MITIVRPPLDDPDSNPDDFWILNKTLYGLRKSPQHWYNLIAKILRDMGLTPSNNNPCLLSSGIDYVTPSATPRHTIHVGLYVNNFFFFSESDTEDYYFKQLLNDKVTNDFMGNANFFLGSSFEWNRRPNRHLLVHVSQQAFA